jgi:hypothetical protein
MRSTRHDKVLLQSVKTLTFHKGGVTKAKRTEPIREYDSRTQRLWLITRPFQLN